MVKKLYLNIRGSITLEAVMVIPVILLILFSIVFFSMYIFQKLTLLDTAIYTARQRAVTWDNSFKDMETGTGGLFSNDGLYWRIFHDGCGDGLVNKKNKQASEFAKNMLKFKVLRETGPETLNIQYSNKLINREVFVEISQDYLLPQSMMKKPESSIHTSVKANVVEPAEFIRNCDLGVHYLNEAANYLQTFKKQGQSAQRNIAVIASLASKSRTYHYPGCKHIKKIKQENMVIFNSEEEANLKGFHICLDCAKRKIKAGKDKN